MKATATLLAIAMTAGAAWAQAPAKKKAPASQAVAGESTPVKAAKPSAAKPATAAAATKPAGKRDPFISIVQARGGPGGPGVTCTTGKRCLVIDQLVLRGVVRTQSGMIAVVANAANKAYFLRENDPVFNGFVSKITGDSVIFRENVMDNLGRQTQREVVKKVSAPAV